VSKWELNQGAVLGRFALKTDNVRKLTITGYDYIVAGLIDLTVWVSHTIDSGTSPTASIAVMADHHVIFQDTGVSLVKLASNKVFMVERFVDYLRNNKPLLLSTTTGYLRFDFMLGSAATYSLSDKF
jgi:hypothetical protein